MLHHSDNQLSTGTQAAAPLWTATVYRIPGCCTTLTISCLQESWLLYFFFSGCQWSTGTLDGMLHHLAISSFLEPRILHHSGHQLFIGSLAAAPTRPSAVYRCPGCCNNPAISCLQDPWLLPQRGHQLSSGVLAAATIRPSAVYHLDAVPFRPLAVHRSPGCSTTKGFS
jgi:hypothetical protein